MLSVAPVTRFGPYELRPSSRELFKFGKRLKLRPQPFQVLSVLLSNAGEVVSREQLHQQLWPSDTFVDFEHGLNTSIKELRAVLDDSPSAPRYIETLPKLGYRFIFPVERPAAAPASSSASSDTPPSIPLPPAVAPIASPQPIRLFSGRHLAYGAAAAILCAASVGAITYVRAHRPPKMLERDTVVLSDFSNTTGDAIFDDTLRQALAVSLRQSPYVNILSDGRTRNTLKLMTRPADSPLTPEVTREICQRTASKAYIQGSIARLGGEYVVGLKAIACTTGDTLAQEQRTAATKEKVLDQLGQATAKMRRELGESLASVEKFDYPLGEITTSSLEALKAYSLGAKEQAEKGPDAIRPYMQRAVELDPNFAEANNALGVSYGNEGQDALAHQYLSKAFALKDHTSERERLHIIAVYHMLDTRDIDKAVAALQEATEKYPNDAIALANLGNSLGSQGNYEKAAEAISRAITLGGPNVLFQTNLGICMENLGRFPDARKIFEDLVAAQKGNAIIHRNLHDIDMLEGKTALAAQELAWFRSQPDLQNLWFEKQATDFAYYGQLAKARSAWLSAATIQKQSGNTDGLGGIHSALAAEDALVGNFSMVEHDARIALQVAPKQYQVQMYVSFAFSEAGDRSKTESVMKDLDSQGPQDTLVQLYWLPMLRAQLALHDKHPEQSIQELQVVIPHEFSPAEEGECGFLAPSYVRGKAYLALHQPAAAIAEFQRIIQRRGRVLLCLTGATAHVWLARAYTMAGDSAKARSEYQLFLNQWKSADADIPILKQAKTEYALLAARPLLPTHQ